ncbi:N-acetyltransferase DgcN [Henriciella sp.]|uniref:N-acetyltransferase DgcN n=1 Tax=Henriciella sp. TaxID=1968823 RepID=UPI002625627F|nr:N-acetyltransferase DgcN [Henriciella sp.]
MIAAPYLLFLGNAEEALSIKTSRGIAQWRPELCVGEYRGPQCTVTTGQPQMDFAEAVSQGAKTMIVGLANAGGYLDEYSISSVIAALEAGLDVASGLHQSLAEHPEIARIAKATGRKLHDVRKPPADLRVGKGYPRAGKRLLTVGTDCSVGKMYATLAIEQEMQRRKLSADFRATGQTGILIAQSGIPVDAVIADFISGAVEQISPAREDDGWDLIEGQGSLFHPSYAGVSLGLLHGAQPDALVLCHELGREHMRGIPGRPLPDLRDCLERNLEAARLTNPDVQAVGVAVNSSKLPRDQALRACADIEDLLGLPCQDPIAHGVAKITDRLSECFELHAVV